MTEISLPELKHRLPALSFDLFHPSDETDVFAWFADGLIVCGIDKKAVITKISPTLLLLALCFCPHAYLANKAAGWMPGFTHGIQHFVDDGFATLAAFRGILIFVTSFAPRIFISYNKRRSCTKWLLRISSAEEDRELHHHSLHRRNDPDDIYCQELR